MNTKKRMARAAVAAVQKRKKVLQKHARCVDTNIKQTGCAIADVGKSNGRNRPIVTLGRFTFFNL